jgi:hypothetical protein
MRLSPLLRNGESPVRDSLVMARTEWSSMASPHQRLVAQPVICQAAGTLLMCYSGDIPTKRRARAAAQGMG